MLDSLYMHSPDHRSFSSSETPRQPGSAAMRARLSAHRGWKERVGAALLTAAGVFGAEGCATTNATPRDEAYSNIQYGAAASARPRYEQASSTQRDEAPSYDASERTAEYVQQNVINRRLSMRSALRELAPTIASLAEQEIDGTPQSSTLFSLNEVQPVTARVLRRAVQNTAEVLQRISRQPDTSRFVTSDQNAVPRYIAHVILLHLHQGGSLGSLAANRALNPGYDTPIDDLRSVFNNQLSDHEIVQADAFATADFVRAYAHALQRQEDRAAARSYERPRNAMRGQYNDDLPSGIAFENQRPAPPSTPPTLRLTENPYGDDTDQPSHRRHHRHHRP